MVKEISVSTTNVAIHFFKLKWLDTFVNFGLCIFCVCRSDLTVSIKQYILLSKLLYIEMCA